MSDARHMRSDASRNHEAILTAAIAVLAASSNASMREIADASGTGRTTLYRHFPDREALVAAIMERVLAEADTVSTAHFEAARRDRCDPVKALATLSAELASLGDRYRFLEQHAPPPSATRRGRRTPSERRFVDYVRAGQASGGIRADLDPDWILDAFGALIARAVEYRFPSAQARGEALARTVEGMLRG